VVRVADLRLEGSEVSRLTQITALATLIEKMSQPGSLGVAGRKIEREVESGLRSYFTALARSVERVNLAELVTLPKSDLPHAVEQKLYNPLRINRSELVMIVGRGSQKAILAGWKHDHRFPSENARESYSESADNFDLEALTVDSELDQLGLTGKQAATWAAEKSADLVRGIDTTTRERLASVVAKGIEEQLGIEGTARLIRSELDDMTVKRSLMIAATEVNDAFTFAALTKMSAQGIEYKRIILSPDACPICEENADAGPIKVDEDFPSGDDGPPFHPLCRCTVTGARPPEDEDDSND
jgi:hypothetical protein